MKLFRGEVFVTIRNQNGTEEVTHLMPETNRFEDPICQTADSNNLPWSETGPPWTILGTWSATYARCIVNIQSTKFRLQKIKK